MTYPYGEVQHNPDTHVPANPHAAQQQQGMSRSEVEAILDEALAKQDAEHRKELAEVQRSAVQVVTNSITPSHAAGPGTDVHKTWSQYDQELSRAGNHPSQHAENDEPEVTREDRVRR